MKQLFSKEVGVLMSAVAFICACVIMYNAYTTIKAAEEIVDGLDRKIEFADSVMTEASEFYGSIVDATQENIKLLRENEALKSQLDSLGIAAKSFIGQAKKTYRELVRSQLAGEEQ
jgi:hypothetical protein